MSGIYCIISVTASLASVFLLTPSLKYTHEYEFSASWRANAVVTVKIIDNSISILKVRDAINMFSCILPDLNRFK